MGYYIRVLGKTNPSIPVQLLGDTLTDNNLDASIHIKAGTPADWTQLIIRNKDGRDLVMIEKNEVVDGELGKEELDDFKEEVADCKPENAARWLADFFDKVKVVYAFQVLDFDDEETWTIIGELKSKIWRLTDGIIQADNEGFTNEDAYHILWQFNDDVTGPWHMAVRDADGNWIKFKMDLGDKQQREEFFKGEVPGSAELV